MTRPLTPTQRCRPSRSRGGRAPTLDLSALRACPKAVPPARAACAPGPCQRPVGGRPQLSKRWRGETTGKRSKQACSPDCHGQSRRGSLEPQLARAVTRAPPHPAAPSRARVAAAVWRAESHPRAPSLPPQLMRPGHPDGRAALHGRPEGGPGPRAGDPCVFMHRGQWPLHSPARENCHSDPGRDKSGDVQPAFKTSVSETQASAHGFCETTSFLAPLKANYCSAKPCLFPRCIRQTLVTARAPRRPRPPHPLPRGRPLLPPGMRVTSVPSCSSAVGKQGKWPFCKLLNLQSPRVLLRRGPRDGPLVQ